MSTSFEHEADKDPDLLEQEINAKREHISDLVDALEQRLSPGQLMDQVLAYGKGNGSEFLHNLGTTLKNNPVPATLTAVGMAWLAMNQNRPFSPGPAHTGAGLGDRLGEAVDAVKGALGHAGDALQDAKHSVQAKAHDLRDSTSGSASSVRDAAYQVGDKATVVKSQFDQLLKEQPLVMAALGIALGAALGAALPNTRKEDQLMGEHSDRLTDALKAKGEQAKEAVTQSVKDNTAPDRHEPAQTDLSSGLGFQR
ncbi:DUF3618 domain-containing protein [Pseudomonas shirazensis]|uniref:DUF3618 domain-containing protein n=1 Tax=Pseudomonas shirazensis TaxID=2745494 RepID=UPI003D29DCA3